MTIHEITSTKPIPKGTMAEEPARTIGTALTTILGGIWLVLKALGIDIAEDLPTAIDVLIGGLLTVPALTGWLTRYFVVSPTTAQAAANDAARTGVAGDVLRGTTAGNVPPGNSDPRYDPNDPTETPPQEWAVNRPIKTTRRDGSTV